MIQTVLSSGRKADLGHGLMVQRLLPHAQQRAVGPFVFFDHAGPVRMAAQAARAADVRPRPHIGLSTVSYLLSGSVTHRASLPVAEDGGAWMRLIAGTAYGLSSPAQGSMRTCGCRLARAGPGRPAMRSVRPMS